MRQRKSKDNNAKFIREKYYDIFKKSDLLSECLNGEVSDIQINVEQLICKEMIRLSGFDKISLTISNYEYNIFVADILHKNNFWSKFPDLMMYVFDEGCGVVSGSLKGDKIVIDYLTHGDYVVLKSVGEHVDDIVFIERSLYDGVSYQLHRRESFKQNGLQSKVIIENTLYQSSDVYNPGKEIPLHEIYANLNISETVVTPKPLFCFIKPGTPENKLSADFIGTPVYNAAVDTINTFNLCLEQLVRGMLSQTISKKEIKQGLLMLNYLMEFIFMQTGLCCYENKPFRRRLYNLHKKRLEDSKKELQNILRESLKSIVDIVINLGIANNKINPCDYSVYIDFDCECD